LSNVDISDVTISFGKWSISIAFSMTKPFTYAISHMDILCFAIVKAGNIKNIFFKCRRSVSILDVSPFGQGEGNIWLKSDDCIMSEENVFGCLHKGLDLHNCDHDNDIAINCSGFL
jgi:hypothetical protein